MDDKQPQGSMQATHWPEPLPESIWCTTCDARRAVTGYMSSDESVTGLHLKCGHREDPPRPIRAA